MLKWTFLTAFSPDGQVICYSEDAEYDPFGFGDYDESDNGNVDCTNGFEGLVSTVLGYAVFGSSKKVYRGFLPTATFGPGEKLH